MATHANWLLDSYVYGFALQEASLPFDTADEFADMVEDVFLPQLPPDEFPYLNESAAALVAAGFDPAEEFIFGLDLVLAALEPLRASASQPDPVGVACDGDGDLGSRGGRAVERW